MRLVYLADAPYVHTRRWAEHFARAGWDTHIVSFRPAAIAGVQVHYLGGLERLGKLRYLLHARRVRDLVRGLRPDLVHGMHLTSYGFLAGICGVTPNVVSVWGTDILEAPAWSPLHHFLTRYALARADCITATGLRLANATLRYVPRAKPVTVVPYGVDLDRFRPPSRDGVRPNDVTVGAIARLSPEKGLDDLLRASAKSISDGAPLHVMLVGDGPERGRLEQLAERLAIADRVEFRGEVAHSDVPGVLGEIDIFAMPSRAEGFGVAALEAQAMERPVVATRVHGIPDVVQDGVTGILVPPGDADALADAIAKLVGDAGLRAALGRRGRAFVEQRYQWNVNTAQMERLYQSLLPAFV